MSAKERKCPQKSANASKCPQKSANASPQKGARGRKRVQKERFCVKNCKQPGLGTPNKNKDSKALSFLNSNSNGFLALGLESCNLKSLQTGGDSNRCKLLRGPNWGLFCPEICAFSGFGGNISSTVSSFSWRPQSTTQTQK